MSDLPLVLYGSCSLLLVLILLFFSYLLLDTFLSCNCWGNYWIKTWSSGFHSSPQKQEAVGRELEIQGKKGRKVCSHPLLSFSCVGRQNISRQLGSSPVALPLWALSLSLCLMLLRWQWSPMPPPVVLGEASAGGDGKHKMFLFLLFAEESSGSAQGAAGSWGEKNHCCPTTACSVLTMCSLTAVTVPWTGSNPLCCTGCKCSDVADRVNQASVIVWQQTISVLTLGTLMRKGLLWHPPLLRQDVACIDLPVFLSFLSIPWVSPKLPLPQTLGEAVEGQGWAGWSFEQPCLMGGVHAYSRGIVTKLS